MLAVIDYGAGNLPSVLHALAHLHAENVHIIRSGAELKTATKIILPGVGAFGAGMAQLRAQNIIAPLKEMMQSGVPYLGICLGMQFLFETSDELGNHDGLGLIEGRVTRFAPSPDHKVPHIGWNQINLQQPSPITQNIPQNSDVYFIHSYYCAPTHQANVIATCDHGISFTAAVQHNNIYGVQFHPEKSQHIGLQVLANFLAL